MIRRPPRSTRTDTLFPYTTLFRSTTSSMLAWILEHAGRKPNFLIGGIAADLQVSARYEAGRDVFVIEADEYDTAFFDKRSKFVHYRPRTAILNNLEYDHAAIFPDMTAIQTQLDRTSTRLNFRH